MSRFRVPEPQAAACSSRGTRRVDLTQVDYHELMAFGRVERARVAADLAGRAWRWLRRAFAGR